MKLFTRYFRINLLATLTIFLLASVAYYFLLWYVMIYQVDEDLKIEQREIENYVNRYQKGSGSRQRERTSVCPMNRRPIRRSNSSF